MRIITLLLTLIILFIGISFAVLNANDATINYYFGTAHLPLSILMVIALIVGVFIGLLSTIFMVIKAKAQQHTSHRQLQHAQQEITNLRKLPLEDK
jgi:putative membrane protein